MQSRIRKASFVLGSSGGRSKLTFIGVLVFLLSWWIISSVQIINPLLLPSPIRVILAANDVGWTLLWHIGATVTRVIVGLVAGILIGAFSGISMQFSRRVYVACDGLVETFRPVPPVALIPFFVLVFGFAEIGKLLIVTFGVSLIVVVITVEAIERVPAAIIRWGLVLGLSRFELFRGVILPAAWPEMRGGFRIALALSVTIVVVSEFMGASHGLGYLINVSKITLTTPTIFLAIILTGWIGWLLDRTLRIVFERTCRWDIRGEGAIR